MDIKIKGTNKYRDTIALKLTFCVQEQEISKIRILLKI